MKLNLLSKQYQELEKEFMETGKVEGEEYAVMISRFKGGKVPIEVQFTNEQELTINCAEGEVKVITLDIKEADNSRLDYRREPKDRISSTLKSIKDDDFEKKPECELLGNEKPDNTFDHLEEYDKQLEDYYLWIVGIVTDEHYKEWEFGGVYSSEKEAKENCLNEKCFYAKVRVGEPTSLEKIDFEYACYPHLEFEQGNKDEMAGTLYSRVYNGEWDRRMVMSNTHQDCYYSGFLDCYEQYVLGVKGKEEPCS